MGRVAEAFRRQNFRAEVFDIRRGGIEHDLSSKQGFRNLFLLGLRLLCGSMLVLGPPCSMYIFLSSSQHLRHIYGPLGNPRDFATALANVIATNTASRRKIRNTKHVCFQLFSVVFVSFCILMYTVYCFDLFCIFNMFVLHVLRCFYFLGPLENNYVILCS